MNDEQPLPRYPGMPAIVDGSEAIAHVETRIALAAETAALAGRVTNWGILFPRSAQEAADLAAIARRVADVTGTPFMVAQDGFLTTHMLESVRLPEDDLLREFVGVPAERIRDRFDPAERPDVDRIRGELAAAMTEWTALTGRPVGVVDAYRCAGASEILVAMGTIADTAIAVVDHLRSRGRPVGCLAVTGFRPFPSVELLATLRRARSVGVVERTDDPLAAANPLTREVRSALYEAAAEGVMVPRVLSFSAGLDAGDIAAGDLVAVFDRLAVHGDLPARHAVLGGHHPLALEHVAVDLRPPGSWSMRGTSIGGFGAATADRLMATLAAELFDKVVQTYQRHDSQREGVPATTCLTIADEPIRLHAEPEQVDLVSLDGVSAFTLDDPLAGLVDGGTVVIGSPSADPEAIWTSLPAPVRAVILARRIRVAALQAVSPAAAHAPGADPLMPVQGVALVGVFLRLSPFAARAGLGRTALLDATRDRLPRFFAVPGDAVIDATVAIISAAYDGLIDVTATLGPLPDSAGEALVSSLESEGVVR